MSAKSQSDHSIYESDRILSFFFRDRRWVSAIRVSGTLFVSVILCYLLSFLDGSLFIEGTSYGAAQDYGMPIKAAVFSISLIVSQGVFDRIPAAFLGDDREFSKTSGLPQVVKFGDNYEQQYVKKSKEILDFIAGKARGKHALLATRFILGFFFSISYLYVAFFAPQETWHLSPTKYPLGYLGSFLQDGLIYLVLAPPVLWRITGMVIGFNVLFRFLKKENKIRLNPISPDGAGGLGELGEIALATSYTIALPMIVIVVSTLLLGLNLIMLLILPAYFILVSAVFFLPMLYAHGIMKEAKKKEKKIIGDLFNRAHARFLELAETKEDEGNRRLIVEEIRGLSTMYSTATAMPVWPFDISTVRRFITVILVPSAVFIFDVYKNFDAIVGYVRQLSNNLA